MEKEYNISYTNVISPKFKLMQSIFDKSIKEIEIPEGATIIPYEMFKDCILLERVTIPNTITTIGPLVFANTILTEVHYNGTISEWNNITLGTKYTKWNELSLIERVICLDGIIEVEG